MKIAAEFLPLDCA